MARGKPPDPKRRKTPHPHAQYLSVKSGGKEAGWKAGELYGCYGHRTHAHQPCVFELTEGALPCPYCTAKHESQWRGYVPIWDRDFCLRYVLVNEDYFESIDQIPHGAQVTVTRGKKATDPLIVRQEAALTKFLPDKDPWSVPVNQLVVCLTLWKHDMLTTWFRVNKPNELLYVRARKEDPAGEKFKKDPLVKLAEAEARAKAEDEAEQMRVAQDMQKLLNPKSNGVFARSKPR